MFGGQVAAALNLVAPLLGAFNCVIAGEGDFDAVGVDEKSVAGVKLNLRVAVAFFGEYSQEGAFAVEVQDAAVGSNDQWRRMARAGEPADKRIDVDGSV